MRQQGNENALLGTILIGGAKVFVFLQQGNSHCLSRAMRIGGGKYVSCLCCNMSKGKRFFAPAPARLISAFTAESACKLHISLLPFVKQLMETADLRVMQSVGFSCQSQLGAYMLTNNKGFTLIELTFVVAVIGILAAVSIPNFIAYRDRAYLCEGYVLSDPVRKEVVEYYDHVGAFPPDNAALGLPEAMRGKHVGSIKVKDGAVEIKYLDDSRQPGVTITLTPVVSSDDPTGPVTWEQKITNAN